MDCQKMDFIESIEMSFYKVERVRKNSNLGILLLFDNYLKNGLITYFYFPVYRFLRMVVINCKDMNLIYVFERSFSRSDIPVLFTHIWSFLPLIVIYNLSVYNETFYLILPLKIK